MRTEVDSGRLYAPFRYGSSTHPMVGAVVPDLAVGGTRLRELARRGLLVLAAGPVELPPTDAPVTVAHPRPSSGCGR